jgi:hypothetical protein
MARLATALLTMHVVCAPAHAAPKTDIVIFQNGDRLTGEIKGLERGKLELKTDSAGTVDIEWDKVASVETRQYLRVETANGRHYFGKVPQVQQDGAIYLVVDGQPQGSSLPFGDVVRIMPIDRGGLIDRLDGYLTVGFNYTKANNETQFNLSGGVSSRDEKRKWSLDGATTINTQSDGYTSSMYDVTLANRRFLPERWFLQYFGTVQGNQELGLDIREVLGGGFGRYLAQDAHNEWVAFAGLGLNRENFRNEAAQNSLEAILATQYSFFQYDTPKRTVNAGLAVFPSLTQSGRVRAEADVESRFEIVKDLFFDVTLYGSYDSDADPAAASNSDYGVVTSLGYSF